MDTNTLMIDALGVRACETGKELWFAVKDELYPEADALHQAGLLDRAWHGDDLVWRISDEAQRQVEARFTLAAGLN